MNKRIKKLLKDLEALLTKRKRLVVNEEAIRIALYDRGTKKKPTRYKK